MNIINLILQHTTTFWLLSSLALLLVELTTPGLFFFVSFAFGCLFGALTAALSYRFTVQCGITLLVSIIQFLSMRRALLRFNARPGNETAIHALVGKRGVVTRAIAVHVAGVVKLGGEEWAAVGINEQKIAQGAAVQVTRIEGNRVIVKEIS